MVNTFDVVAGIWLSALPLWGGGVVPATPPVESPLVAVASRPAVAPASLVTASDEDLRAQLEMAPASLGSLSIGAPGSAILLNAVSMPPGSRWEIAPNADSWGTAETIEGIQTAINTVNDLFPDTPPVVIGDISAPDGGHLHRHASHQGGRDADIGFYYKDGKTRWFVPGNAANLDLPRNWALVRAFVVRTDVEAILLDTRVQRLIYKYALSIGEDKEWLDQIFQIAKGSFQAIVRHVPLHQTHYHVRFYSPVAQELGRRAHALLVQLKIIKPPIFTISHRSEERRVGKEC
jgi:murein endopeptidase